MEQNDLLSNCSTQPMSQPDEVGVNSVVTNLTADQLHFFGKLPVEIRLEIWKCICFFPRLVDVFSSGTGCEALHNLDSNFHDLFGGALRVDYNATHCHPPTVLHVCQESRVVGLQFYKLAFGKGPFSATPPTSINISFFCKINMPAHIYINWKCDIVCPMGAEIRERKDMEVQLLETEVSSGKVLRYLAIDPLNIEIPVGTSLIDNIDSSDEEPELSWAHLLRNYSNLEEIILYYLPRNYRMDGTPLELIDISEVNIERGKAFMVPQLKRVREVILNLMGRIEVSRKATELQELSKVREAWVPLLVRIMGVKTGVNEQHSLQNS